MFCIIDNLNIDYTTVFGSRLILGVIFLPPAHYLAKEGLFLILQIYVHMDAWILTVFQDTDIFNYKSCVTKMGNFVGN